MKPSILGCLTTSLMAMVLCASVQADVVYDAGPGPVGSDLAALPNWFISGSGDFTGNIGGIDDNGTPAYQLVDDNLPAAGNGPTAGYSYLADFGLTNTQTDMWSAKVNMRTIVGDGGINGVFQVYDSDGVGRWLTFIYEDTAGDLIMNTLASMVNLGPNDDAYHDYEIRGNGDGSANFFFNDVDQGVVPFRAGDGAGALGVRMDIGGGSTGATGGWYINQVEFVGTPGVPRPVLVIDRDTGNITLNNQTMDHVDNIVGYTILSSAGSLDQSGWDQQATGSQLANDNDQWTVLTEAGVSTDLAEVVLITTGDGDGGDLLGFGGAWDFGNVWRKSFLEDIQLELLIDDGSDEGLILSNAAGDFDIVYAGDPIDPADLDGNGVVNTLDWVAFKNAYGTDVTGMTTFDAYQNGDINLDGVSNQRDFVAYRNLYAAAVNEASLQSVATVPEPATWLLVVLGTLTFGLLRNMKIMLRKASLATLALAVPFALATNVDAQILVPIFDDDFESYAIGDPADFTTGADNWVHNGNGTPPNASRIFASPNFVPSGTQKLWIAGAANAAAGSGINSKHGIEVAANTDYLFRAALVAETFNPNRTATGTYDLLVGTSLGTAASVIGGPQAFFARGDDAPGGEGTYEDQFTTHEFNSGAVGTGERLFITIAFDGTDATNPFVGIDEVSINDFAELGVNVNTTTGQVTFFGDPVYDFDITSYSLTSSLGQFMPGNLTSLESQHIGDPAMDPNNGVGFEVLGTPSSTEIAEGDLTGSSVFGSDTAFSLGNIFDTSTPEAERDLQITFTNLAGDVLVGTVNFFAGTTVDGDYNGDGVVDAADYTLWRDNLGASVTLNGENPAAATPGVVDAEDYLFWKSRFGATSAAGGLTAAAVPEPSTALLALFGVAGACGLAFRRKERRSLRRAGVLVSVLTLIVAWAVAGSPALAAVTNDRFYSLGDDGAEGAIPGNTVGSAVGGVTFDSAGTVGAGDLQDLTVNGSPTYVSVSDRPGAGGGDLGASFDGSIDSLSTGISMNAPAQMWDNGMFFPGPPGGVIFPHNYEGIFSHGIQLWAKPNQAALGTVAQTLVQDTPEHGIAITESGNWQLLFDKLRIDTGVAVADTLDENGWAHVMEIAGFSDRFNAGTASGGALLVNGVAVAAQGSSYDPAATPLVVGAESDGQGGFLNHYNGTLDDVRLFLWGDNSNQLGQDGAPGGSNTDTAANNGLNADGQNWGTLDLGTDNDWIANRLSELNVIDRGDVDLSGGAADTDDVTEFLTHWRKQQVINGVQIGDWNSRLEGDLNYDGIVDLRDAMILHNSLMAAGAGGLDFSLLMGGTNVPEPSTCILAALGLLAAAIRYRHAKNLGAQLAHE